MEKYFSSDELNGNTLFETLLEACNGLIYTSETDAPVEAFQVPTHGRSAKDVLIEIYGSDDAGEVVEEQGIEPFFERAARIADWHDASRKKRAETFQQLRELLEKNLRSVSVYRLGTVDVAIFVAGLDDEQKLVGVRTRSVET